MRWHKYGGLCVECGLVKKKTVEVNLLISIADISETIHCREKLFK